MLFTDEQLEEKLREATQDQSLPEFKRKIVMNTAKVLKSAPLSYRYYGVYWWSLKSIMIEHGVDWIDDETDAEWIEKANTGSPEKNLIAGWLLAEEARAIGTPSPYSATMDKEYFLYDKHMEELALLR